MVGATTGTTMKTIITKRITSGDAPPAEGVANHRHRDDPRRGIGEALQEARGEQEVEALGDQAGEGGEGIDIASPAGGRALAASQSLKGPWKSWPMANPSRSW